MRSHSEDDMNERAVRSELPREEDPGRAVEDRIVRALKRRGLLRDGRSSRGTAWWLRAAAASLVLFGGGVALGEYHGQHRTEQRLGVARQPDAGEAAMLVQRTGSAYVEALARLAEMSASGADAAEAKQGRDVAMSAFQAAATEFHQVAPDDPFANRLLDAVAAGRTESTPGAAPPLRRVVFY
jgi:hypothetical protein